jgi:hypothetical protein
MLTGRASALEHTMKVRHWMQLAAMASAIGFAGSAGAADAGMSTSQMQNGGPSPAGSVQSAVPPNAAAVGGTERVDNSNGIPLSDAARAYAQRNGGNLPPVVVMDRNGTAWDVVGVEPYDTTPNAPQVILLRPHGRVATAIVVPDGSETVYVQPNGDRVVYLAPSDDTSARMMDRAPPGASGFQLSPPSYMGENSDKGQ